MRGAGPTGCLDPRPQRARSRLGAAGPVPGRRVDQIAAGDRASSEIYWLREFCHEPRPAAMRLSLPHDGGEVTAVTHTTPACASQTEPAAAGRLSYGFLRRGAHHLLAAYTPEARLEAKISHAHDRVLQGNELHYRVRLESYARGQIQLDPCLPYREQLLERATGAVVAEQTYVLNCDPSSPAPDTPSSGYRNYYAMQLAVPTDLAPGRYDLRWQSVLEPVTSMGRRTVRVLAAPAPCTQPQLRITASQGGVGLGSFYQPVVFRNISRTACSLRGFPGVEYAAPDGSAIATSASHRTDIAFRTVALLPGRAASASLSGSDSGPNGGATPCPEVSGVRVIAPGLSTQVLVRGVIYDCNGGHISVTPVQPGARPQP